MRMGIRQAWVMLCISMSEEVRMEAVTGIILAAVPSVLSGIVLAVVSKSQKKAEEREKDRNEREVLTLDSLNAIFCVTKELTECVLNGRSRTASCIWHMSISRKPSTISRTTRGDVQRSNVERKNTTLYIS